MRVAEVMNNPCGDQVPQRDSTEFRMSTAEFQFLGRQVQGPQVVEVLRPEGGECLKQIRHRLASAGLVHRIPVKRRKRGGFAVFQDDTESRHPVGSVGVDKVTDDIERAESIIAVVAQGPAITQSTKQGAQYLGCPLKNLDGFRPKCQAECAGL
jgi:hypothetical protein